MRKLFYLMTVLALPVLLTLSGPLVSTAVADEDEDDNITICHMPGTENVTMTVDEDDWEDGERSAGAHKRHGDTEGACTACIPTTTSLVCHNSGTAGQVTVKIDNCDTVHTAHIAAATDTAVACTSVSVPPSPGGATGGGGKPPASSNGNR